MPYVSAKKVPEMLTGGGGIGDCDVREFLVTLSCRGDDPFLLAYDLFEDGDASGQIVPIDYEWRKDAQCVFPRGQR